MSLSKKPPCKHCGHKEHRHIRKQGPNNAVCMNMMCPCPNYEARDVYKEIREAGERGLMAGQLKKESVDAFCDDCGHRYTQHNQVGESGVVFRRPCGESDCQCDDFAFDIPEGLQLLDLPPMSEEMVNDVVPASSTRVTIGDTSYSVAALRDRLNDALETLNLFENPNLIAGDPEVLDLINEMDDPMCTECGHTKSHHNLNPKKYPCAVADCDCVGFDNGESPSDAVNHPSHYNQQGPEVIELVRWKSFNRGSAIKYIARAGFKDPDKEAEDLEKAIWYLEDELKIIRGEVK